jgi:hypothetical protein
VLPGLLIPLLGGGLSFGNLGRVKNVMKNIVLQAQNFSPEIGQKLEELNLISFIHHPETSLRETLQEPFYQGENFQADKHGFHSVTITYTEIFPAYHPYGENEIVMMWDPVQQHRPLYFVFALHKKDEYLDRLCAGKISEEDYVAIRVPYNDPQYSSFIVWNETVHCELTDNGNPGWPYPSFFVLEPDPLTVHSTEEKKAGIHLKLEP